MHLLSQAGALQKAELMFALEFACRFRDPADRERCAVGVSSLALLCGQRSARYTMKFLRQLGRELIDKTIRKPETKHSPHSILTASNTNIYINPSMKPDFMHDESSPTTSALATRIDALLPQTQCTRCGYPACRDYAAAIARGDADINQCPPGGAAGIVALAELLGRATKPLNPAHGIEQSMQVAWIDEAICIGCTKCIQVCPVDAIVGASKLMHTILARECSGCELCIPACPVDCIAMTDDPVGAAPMQRAPQFRQRFLAREARLAREREARDAAIAARKAQVHGASGPRSAVLEAIARAKARKGGTGMQNS